MPNEGLIKTTPTKGTPSKENDTSPTEKEKEATGLRTRMEKVELEVGEMKRDIRSLKDDFQTLQEEIVRTVKLVDKLVARGEEQEQEDGGQQHQSPSHGHEKGYFYPNEVVDLSNFKSAAKKGPVEVQAPIVDSPRISEDGSSTPPPNETPPLTIPTEVVPQVATTSKYGPPKFLHEPVRLR